MPRDVKRSGEKLSWEVRLKDGKHTISFSHNTLSGNRVVRLDGRELWSSGWMFKLIGDTPFTFEHMKQTHHCSIKILPTGGLAYTYQLSVDGKTLTRIEDLARFAAARGPCARWEGLMGRAGR